ncbi:MAG: putative Rossmann fold flavoprotein [Candidatus Paceibacteria bacterium]|jgi:predicted Rossmann fold flavoprotein
MSDTNPTPHDLVIIGGGASGMVAAIAGARAGKRVLICERSSSPGRKLLASGGERCNLSNTLSSEDFMERVGRDGRFMGPALELLGGPKLRDFFADIGLKTVVLDGFRVWPETRKSSSVLAVLLAELEKLGVQIALNCDVQDLSFENSLFRVEHDGGSFQSKQLIVATGGLALPGSGSSGGGYKFAESLGHRITTRFPAGVPFVTREDWPARCTAHTIGKARMQVAIRKHSRIVRTGDLIFTKRGIKGPLVLDISREISPLLDIFDEVPIWMNLCRGKNQEDWQAIMKDWRSAKDAPLIERLQEQLPLELAEVMCELAGVSPALSMHQLKGQPRDDLIQVLVKTPLTITGTTGYEGAFITRGGVRLKEVKPDTLESKLVPGLYLCGEVLDLDGPCGGFNLQWAFASGFLAGRAAIDAPSALEH